MVAPAARSADGTEGKGRVVRVSAVPPTRAGAAVDHTRSAGPLAVAHSIAQLATQRWLRYPACPRLLGLGLLSRAPLPALRLRARARLGPAASLATLPLPSVTAAPAPALAPEVVEVVPASVVGRVTPRSGVTLVLHRNAGVDSKEAPHRVPARHSGGMERGNESGTPPRVLPASTPGTHLIRLVASKLEAVLFHTLITNSLPFAAHTAPQISCPTSNCSPTMARSWGRRAARSVRPPRRRAASAPPRTIRSHVSSTSSFGTKTSQRPPFTLAGSCTQRGGAGTVGAPPRIGRQTPQRASHLPHRLDSVLKHVKVVLLRLRTAPWPLDV